MKKTKRATAVSTHRTHQLPKLPRLRPHRPRVAVSNLFFRRVGREALGLIPCWNVYNHRELIFVKYFLEAQYQSVSVMYSIYIGHRNSTGYRHILCVPCRQSDLAPLLQSQPSLESFGTPNIRLPQNLEIDKSKLQELYKPDFSIDLPFRST